MVSDRMGARAVDLLLGQINDSEGPPQEVVMRSLLCAG
jgi:DNA-binding LacI/PurR family transcriptional regulator